MNPELNHRGHREHGEELFEQEVAEEAEKVDNDLISISVTSASSCY
jgi:hypothetical protein